MARPKLKSKQKAQPPTAGSAAGKGKAPAPGNVGGKAKAAVAAPIRHVDEDTKLLHNMGYAQELARRMSGFSNFAISFSIICILAGGITAFGAGFSAMGGASIGIGWLVGGLFAMIVALSMGQIASAYPTAGGLYHWGSILGGRAWGWSTAWFNLLGLIFVVASVDVGVYNLFKDLVLNGVFGMDVSGFGLAHLIIGTAVILIAQALLNHYGIRVTTMLTDISGYLILAVAIVLTIALVAFAPNLDFGRLFTFSNFTGDAGGGVWPRTENAFVGFLLGLLLVCYTITGYDASAHTSEETRDAAVSVPRGMWHAVLWSVIFGYFMVCAFVLAMPSMEEGAAQGWGVFLWLMNNSPMPTFLRDLLFIGIVIANFLCGLAGLTSCSRMMYAFARDGGLPYSKQLAEVSAVHRTPVNAIWVSSVLILISTLYAPAFLVLAAGCAVFLYLSYVMPIAAGLLAEGKSWTKKGPFNLGIFSKPAAVVAIIGGLVLAWAGFQPPNEKVLYLTVGLIVAQVALWYGLERKRFEGPPMGDRILQRQVEIAKIEERLAGQSAD
jgi:amino acid transporter